MIRVFPLALVFLFVGCLDRPPGTPEATTVPIQKSPESAKGGGGGEATPDQPPADPAVAEKPVPSPDGKDPLKGTFSLEEATAGLEGSGNALIASIKTSKGDIKCKLFEDKAPITVANFVGLARGVRPYKSHVTKQWVTKPIYDGTTFHRVIKGFMIQGGDPEGTGAGEPGFVIPDEIWPGAKHDHAGQLCMANRGPNTNGMQFFITDAASSALDGKYTIFGECTPTTVVRTIATVPKGVADRPDTPVKINKVEIARGDW